ncbi:hypothetical protein K7X08_007394 [Anisodus acutangulus]|uniref:Uncharacterized protein n=1 Tax=Anisodus acutangulus TaxID=402998 RepID=A0A9Q1LG41_9SOLA|nr:hypothetical protein K7X08_007394 [Anisodus acutangulus]
MSFYPGKFSEERRSIIPAGDTSQFIFSRDASIGILEEPEHLDWYRHGKHWTDQFNHAVGIIDTNYLEYFKRENDGALQAFLVKHINNWIARAYCDKVLRLSAATQDLPKSLYRGRDDADDSLLGDVLCTAMAEALAMGKIGPPVE